MFITYRCMSVHAHKNMYTYIYFLGWFHIFFLIKVDIYNNNNAFVSDLVGIATTVFGVII